MAIGVGTTFTYHLLTLLSTKSHTNSPYRSRRSFLASASLLVAAGGDAAAETIGKDPQCNDSTCLGVWDGLLADCPHSAFQSSAGCVSSQDDTPGVFAEPWDYSEDDSLLAQMSSRSSTADDAAMIVLDKIQTVLQLLSLRRGDQVQTVLQQGRYLRVAILDGRSSEEVTGEFYITPNDTTVQFRIAGTPGSSTRRGGGGSSLRSIERAESIRKELRFLKLPVLRNRQRSLLFVESDLLDRFGPSGSDALGPPAELGRNAMEGRAEWDPRLKTDLLQQFPRRQ